jgi:hypothetical protein
MAEVSSIHGPWLDSAELARMPIPDRVAALHGYGPIAITTAQPNIAGVRYRPAEEHGKIATIRDKRLQVDRAADRSLQISAVSDRQEETPIDLEQIVGVAVDHPLGGKMPLHGQATGWVVLENAGGGAQRLYQMRKYIEYGAYQRWESGRTQSHPGIVEYRGYSAPQDVFGDMPHPPIPSLEEAVSLSTEKGYRPDVYLVSEIEEGLGILSVRRVRTPFEEPLMVAARRPRHPDIQRTPIMQVEAMEYPVSTSDQDLLAAHRERAKDASSDHQEHLGWPVKQMAADAIMLYAISD